jgi:hypothetical protein
MYRVFLKYTTVFGVNSMHRNNEKVVCKHGFMDASFSSYSPFEKRFA